MIKFSPVLLQSTKISTNTYSTYKLPEILWSFFCLLVSWLLFFCLFVLCNFCRHLKYKLLSSGDCFLLNQGSFLHCFYLEAAFMVAQICRTYKWSTKSLISGAAFCFFRIFSQMWPNAAMFSSSVAHLFVFFNCKT